MFFWQPHVIFLVSHMVPKILTKSYNNWPLSPLARIILGVFKTKNLARISDFVRARSTPKSGRVKQNDVFYEILNP